MDQRIYMYVFEVFSQPVGSASSIVIGHSKSIISVIGYDKCRILLIGKCGRRIQIGTIAGSLIGDDKSEIGTIRRSMPRQ